MAHSVEHCWRQLKGRASADPPPWEEEVPVLEGAAEGAPEEGSWGVLGVAGHYSDGACCWVWGRWQVLEAEAGEVCQQGGEVVVRPAFWGVQEAGVACPGVAACSAVGALVSLPASCQGEEVQGVASPAYEAFLGIAACAPASAASFEGSCFSSFAASFEGSYFAFVASLLGSYQETS